nr:hypothetical protein BaRGS_032426 [Batillaria attramentaria]
MFNLFARYAIRHNLDVALPRMEVTQFRAECKHCFSSLSRDEVLPLAQGQQYNMLINRVRFDRESIVKLMPANTFYCTMIRQPISRLFSAMDNHHELRDIKQQLNRIAYSERKEGNHTQSNSILQGDPKEHPYSHLFYNTIASDLGLAGSQMNPDDSAHHGRTVEMQMDSVMIMDVFEESLLLLKRRAGLQLQDILFLSLNSGEDSERFSWDRSYNVRRILAKWQKIDDNIYYHFYSKHKRMVKAQGGFHAELNNFLLVLRRVKRFCDVDHSLKSDMLIQKSAWNEEFIWTQDDCRLMKLGQQEMTKLLVKRHQERKRCWEDAARAAMDPAERPHLE